MKSYFLSVIVLACFGGICEELLPSRAKTQPYVRLVSGLCVLLALVLPAKDAIAGISDFLTSFGEDFEAESREDFYEELFLGTFSGLTAEAAEQYLAEQLTKVFSISAGGCRTEMTLAEDGTVCRVLVCLSGEGIFHDPHAIAEYVREQCGCPCDVVVE